MEAPTNRDGTFSSSQIHKLLNFDKKGEFNSTALKYIKQVNNEIKLGRSLNKEVSAKALDWGNMGELRVFGLLPADYQLISKYRLFHPEIKRYSGMPDLIKLKVGADIKCPYSLEVFCDKVDSLSNIETYKENYPEDYWQHISSAILLESNGVEAKKFEAIIYMPYKSELEEIKEFSKEYFSSKYNWVLNSNENELPYLIDKGYYKNLNIFSFDVPEEDKKLLLETVKKAEKLLIERPKLEILI